MRSAPTGASARRVDACLNRCVVRALFAAMAVLLLLASVVAVLALLLTIADARSPALFGPRGQTVLLFSIAATRESFAPLGITTVSADAIA